MKGEGGIYIGLGSNLPDSSGAPPAAIVARAVAALEEAGVRVVARSRLYSAAPIPASDQPRYLNAVIEVETSHSPRQLMQLLLQIEARNARKRGEKGAARTLDLDLIDYRGLVVSTKTGDDAALELPHPRMHLRRFVLAPLADIASGWSHPVTGETVESLLSQSDVAAQDVSAEGDF